MCPEYRHPHNHHRWANNHQRQLFRDARSAETNNGSHSEFLLQRQIPAPCNVRCTTSGSAAVASLSRTRATPSSLLPSVLDEEVNGMRSGCRTLQPQVPRHQNMATRSSDEIEQDETDEKRQPLSINKRPTKLMLNTGGVELTRSTRQRLAGRNWMTAPTSIRINYPPHSSNVCSDVPRVKPNHPNDESPRKQRHVL